MKPLALAIVIVTGALVGVAGSIVALSIRMSEAHKYRWER